MAAEHFSERVGFSPSEWEWSNDRMNLLMVHFPRQVALLIHSDELEEQLAVAQEEADEQDSELNYLLRERANMMETCSRRYLAMHIPISDGENMVINIATEDHHEILRAIDYLVIVLNWAKTWMTQFRAATKGLDQAEWKMHQFRYVLGHSYLD